MSNHIHFNDQTPYGRQLRRMLQLGEEADDAQKDVRDMMIQMRENDGSADSDYATIVTRFGFESNAKARAAFEEIDSAWSKISGDGNVSAVRAARDQLFSKLRG